MEVVSPIRWHKFFSAIEVADLVIWVILQQKVKDVQKVIDCYSTIDILIYVPYKIRLWLKFNKSVQGIR